MVSDQEIASCVESLLRQAGPKAAAAAPSSVPAVVRQLEAKLGLDLSHKAAFIRDQIDLLLGPHRPKDHFALAAHHLPQFLQQPQQQQQMAFDHPNMAAAIPPASSPFNNHPNHHELSFGHYPASIPAAAAAAAAAQHHLRQQQFQQQQQQMQQAAQPLSPPVAVKQVVPAQKESAPKRKGGPGGLSKVCGVSPELQAIVGEPTMARTQIVKQLWAYIRKNNLQDPNNKRKIICNEELRQVFETDCTDMFKMNKLLAKHIRPLDSTKEPGPDLKKPKANATEVVLATKPEPDRYPIVISDALSKFFGAGEKEMLQSEASQRVWDYIKSNRLEDPMNTMVILCDSKLQELFGCESLSALGVSQLLSRHMFKKS